MCIILCVMLMVLAESLIRMLCSEHVYCSIFTVRSRCNRLATLVEVFMEIVHGTHLCVNYNAV